MDYGFVRAAAFTPKIKVADTKYNTQAIKKLIDEAVNNQVRLAVFPELCITGYTCSDLFLQTALLKSAVSCTEELAEYTRGKELVVLVGLPFMYNGKLYNVAAVLAEGEVKGLIPKRNLPNYGEFYEARHFHRGFEKVRNSVQFGSFKVPFGMNILFTFSEIENLILAVEICEDLWVPLPPCIRHTTAGATIIANLSAGDETTGKAAYRKGLVTSYSGSLICGYIYASAGEGESSTDMVFSGHNLIAENGNLLAETKRFLNQSVTADIDVEKLVNERRRMTTYPANSCAEYGDKSDYLTVEIGIHNQRTDLQRFVDSMPFVPSNTKNREFRCEEILMIQAMGLKKRLEHTNCKHAVIGISGGLDSTLALLVIVKAFDLLKIERSGILAVTMPGFGTTDRTYDNALKLIQKTGATLKEINISRAVRLHFEEIGHDEKVHDVTYENSQARQRTLLLMDLANKVNGMVVGTGDLSELALGWATYNGDHMSMYAVNSSVPKTLVRYLVQYYADTCGDISLKETLYDVLNTPVSPELLPPDESGKIAQKTEDLVGPYELHDFFLYNMLRNCYEPAKIYYLACHAFKNCYEPDVILKWLRVFYKRFFAQQFKRSCIPDGVKVGSVTVSPRGDLRMPSDACANVWLSQLDSL
ncbi:MAG: NAD(+) synthase [Lachnospiraceae bacterium]|nr:NAD(+) synthase [Lachnospiraceae bacterium]